MIVRDDEPQAARARAILARGDAFVPLTVVLETHWLLCSYFRRTSAEAALSLRAVLSLPGVAVEHPDRVAFALDRAEAGMGFADALHLASAEGCDALLTFDRAFIRAAARTPGSTPVRDAADP